MFVQYDRQAAEAATRFTPAFEAGRYPARALGMKQEPMSQGGGGPKLVVQFEVWQRPDRNAPTRNVNAHFCLSHPKPQARGLFHARLKDLGVAAGCFDERAGGTNVAAVIGQWVEVELTKEEGTNKDGQPTAYNNINGFAMLHKPAAPTGPAAPTAGLAAPEAPAPAAPQATAAEYAAASQGYAGTDQTGYDPHHDPYAPPGGVEGPAGDDGIPF